MFLKATSLDGSSLQTQPSCPIGAPSKVAWPAWLVSLRYRYSPAQWAAWLNSLLDPHGPSHLETPSAWPRLSSVSSTPDLLSRPTLFLPAARQTFRRSSPRQWSNTQPLPAFALGGLMLPRLSVVLCSLNGATRLDRCLRALAAQTILSSLEIIVVDDGST